MTPSPRNEESASHIITNSEGKAIEGTHVRRADDGSDHDIMFDYLSPPIHHPVRDRVQP